MSTSTAVTYASVEARLAAAQADNTHLRGRLAELSGRINRALHLVSMHDPNSGPGWTAQLQVELRDVLTGPVEAKR